MSPLNFAIIGAGNIGTILAEAIAHTEVACTTVVCSPTPGRGRALANRFDALWMDDYRTAVARSDVDVVAVCTPSGTHAEIAIAAAEAGKHLLVEKPIDITLARVDAMIESVDRTGVTMACVFPMRFTAGVVQARKALDAGRLGRLVMADAYVKWQRPPAYYAHNWRGTWSMDGGGALMNQSIHTVDLMQWLAGPVATVMAHTGALIHDIETEDTACALLTFENGAMGVIQGATSCWPGDPARVEFHGDQGTIVLEEGRIVRWQLASAHPGEEAEMLGLEEESASGSQDPTAIGFEKHRRQVVDLVDAIRTGRQPAIPGREARRSVEIIRAIYRAAASGSRVRLPLALDLDGTPFEGKGSARHA